MALVNLNVLDGFDSGRVFAKLPTPITIGREEGNTIRLNDERISRFHLKVQEDRGHVVLTDLESTNGTRVNGETVRISLLRPGDQIRIGSTLLVFGSAEEILSWVSKHTDVPMAPGGQLKVTGANGDVRIQVQGDVDNIDPETPPRESPDQPPPSRTLLSLDQLAAGAGGPAGSLKELWGEPPSLPGSLSPAQAAQLSELLTTLHRRLRAVVDTISVDRDHDKIQASLPDWQRVLSLQMDLARLIREIAEPV